MHFLVYSCIWALFTQSRLLAQYGTISQGFCRQLPWNASTVDTFGMAALIAPLKTSMRFSTSLRL